MQTKTENKEKDPAVCRTCLTPITGISFRLQEQSGFGKGLMFTHILRYIVPELYLGLSHGPEICYDCKESLRIAYAFRKRCLETEALIGDYLKTRRCTAQAIELSSVIDYVKQFKGKLDAQSILSEWTEDSIEDFPQIYPTDGDTRQGSKLEMALSETAMNPASSQPLPDPNANSILSSASSRQVIRKIRIPKLTKSSEPSEIAPTQPTEANKENKTGKKHERVEVLKVCPKTGLFKNKAGKYLNLQGEEMTEAVVEDMNTKQLSKPKDIDNQNKVESPTKMCKKQTSSSNIVIENSMDICEETGLLRDQNGHYFDFSGNPLEEEQVKEEKRKAKIRGENLFKISNICTVTDAEFENKNKTSGPADFEEKIEMYQIAKQDASNNNATAQPDRVSHELIKELQKPLKHKENVDNTVATITPIPIENQGGNLFGNNITSTLSTILSSPVNILNFQADENLRIPQQWNPIIQSPKSPKKSNVLSKKNVYKVKKIVKESDTLSNSLSGTFFRISNPITGSYLDSLVPNISTQSTASSQSTSTTTNTLLPNINQTAQSGLYVNSISDYIPVRIKQEPADEPVVNSTVGNTTGIDDNEDTLSAPDLSLDDTSTTTSWQNLINSLDTCETSQYIDVPDFVQIQNFSIDDLLKLRKQKRSKDSKEKSENSNVAKSNNSKQLSLLKSQKKDGGLPDQFIYRGKLLVKTSEGYTFDESLVNPVRVAGTDTQQETNATPISEPVEKIKRKLKIASFPQKQKVTAQDPLKTERDKELCVLFTNYTYDGMYINDHDYLTSPYVRNKLLFNEDKKRYCMCYICGLKHLLKDHVIHMNSHRSTCPCCSINLGTSYMLNLHMKNHSKPCKYCTETIPYPLIQIHLSKHAQEEEEYEEDAFKQKYRRRRGRPRNDPDEEVRFHGVFPSRGRRKAANSSYNMRETRSSGRSDESPDKKYMKLEDPLSLKNCSERKIRGRRGKYTSQNCTMLNNPYVLLERIPNDLINYADVQKILENYENSSDNYPVAIAETDKIKIETDVEEAFNENKFETNVDVKNKKRRGRPEKRFKLYRETKVERKPQRVLRSSFRKKEETEIRVSERENDIEYEEERGKVKQSVETVADKTQADEKSVDEIDACEQAGVSEKSVDNETPADGKSEDKNSVESNRETPADEKSVDGIDACEQAVVSEKSVDNETPADRKSEDKNSVESNRETPADEKSVDKTPVKPVDKETFAVAHSEAKTSVETVEKETPADEKSVEPVDNETPSEEKLVDKTSVQSVNKEVTADEISIDKTSVELVDKEASADEKSVGRTSVESADNETPADDKPVDEVVSEEKLSTERVSDQKSLETSNTHEQSLENPVAVENPEREVTNEVQ